MRNATTPDGLCSARVRAGVSIGVYHRIGIDVAKETLAVCRWDRNQPEPCWERSYCNTEQGIRALLADTPAELAWVLEPTGRYSELAVRIGQAAGRQVLSASPFAVKRYLQSVNPRAKTDRVDARGLARYGQQLHLRPFRLKEPRLQRLRELLQVRCGIAKHLAALRQQVQTMPAVAGLLRPFLESAQAQTEALEAAIQQAGASLELFVRLDQITGVGPLTAAALTVRLMSMEFDSYDQFVAYVGLDLRACDSGEHRGQRRLSKRGDAQLRWLLYLAAKAALTAKKDTVFIELYERECAKGLSKTGALCAVARRIARTAWSMARTGQNYNCARLLARQLA
jgi:transposase